MTRYAGIKQDRIRIVSDQPFHNDDLTIVEVPESLSTLSSAELIESVKYTHGRFKSKHIKIPTKDLRIAFVSNWKMRCGISTYAEHLFPEIGKHVEDVKLFVEENDILTSDIYQFGETVLRSDQVVACWKRNQSLLNLATELKAYDPDIILINHEWGLFSNGKHWLSFLTQISEYRTIVILHSVFPEHLDKLAIEASMPEMVVHLEKAREHLDKMKIGRKVSMIPHGCYPFIKRDPIHNLYGSNHTFIQTGFGFHYKAMDESIKTVGLLKEKFPDVFLTIIFSESPFAKREHERYYQELMTLIKELNIRENVGIIRGFQSDDCIDAYFRCNSAAVFPYRSSKGHEVYGASGACRLAMSKGVPIITSEIPHFSDIPSIKANDAEGIAAALTALFTDEDGRQRQIAKQNAFIVETNWEKVGIQFVKVLED